MAAAKGLAREQIVAKLREAAKVQAQGATVAAVCKKLGISEQRSTGGGSSSGR